MTRRSRAHDSMLRIARSAAGIIAVALVIDAAAAAPAGVTLSKPWIRFILPSRPAAGYFTLTNTADKVAVLDGVKSPACGELMLHRSIREGGIERMTMESSVDIPAHGTLRFAPGGYHLMCVSPTAALAPGGNIAVTLHFRDGSELTAAFPVRSMKDE